ncbi:hypothetical protein PAPYR_11278 [Paratrimastix pyriformis]|uniref:CTLH domain-containing protein n=1 Tax=Paratrimastix pyriformis TaxID=342808 RepID=A0ABQ8U452_9EUKA|nr:hypothetical protein PAPYR_11278 [Paratrimastix pyriformis]
MPHRLRNARGWLPCAFITNPTREAKQATFSAILRELVELEGLSPRYVPEIFALCGDHVALNELCGLVRPGRSHHACLYCESFSIKGPASSEVVMRSSQRAQEVQESFRTVSQTRQNQIKRDTGYLPGGTPTLALLRQLEFDPFTSCLMDLDHVESGHAAKFLCKLILQGHHDQALRRLEIARSWLPSHVGPIPRLDHAKKMSFGEWRLLLQLAEVLLWDVLPASHLALLQLQTRYLAIFSDRFSSAAELQLAIALVKSHRDFLMVCFADKLPNTKLNLHTSRFSSQVAHMNPAASAHWLLVNGWHVATLKSPEQASSPLLVRDSIIAKRDFVLFHKNLPPTTTPHDACPVSVLRVVSICEGHVEGQLWRRSSCRSCPFPTFRETEDIVIVPTTSLLEKVMIVPDCSGKLDGDCLLNTRFGGAWSRDAWVGVSGPVWYITNIWYSGLVEYQLRLVLILVLVGVPSGTLWYTFGTLWYPFGTFLVLFWYFLVLAPFHLV